MSAQREQFRDMLIELAEAGMALSRDLLGKALAADDRDDKIAYAQGHERAARSVRLSIALHDKLDRPVVESRPAPATPQMQAVNERRATLRRAVRRSIHLDHEGEDAEMLETALEAVLDELVLGRGFLDRPANELAILVRETLKLPRTMMFDLPDPRPGPGDHAPAPLADLASQRPDPGRSVPAAPS